jgi:hypothetical protein
VIVTPPLGGGLAITIPPADVDVHDQGTRASFVLPATLTAGDATVVVATAAGESEPLVHTYVAP